MSLTHNQRPSEWDKLLCVAYELIDQVQNTLGDYPLNWSFGGGTAMMLQIKHRESHDIDLFLDDAQLLGFFSPEKNDFNLSMKPADYKGDGSRFQKFAFNDIGEIDFIVSSSLTYLPYIAREILGRQVKLETVPEIITKKVYFRGSEAKARDIFDIAAAARTCRDEMVLALSKYPDQVEATAAQLKRLKPEFVLNTINQLMISPEYKDLPPQSMDIVAGVLEDALKAGQRSALGSGAIDLGAGSGRDIDD